MIAYSTPSVPYYDNQGTSPDEAINTVDGKVFDVVQIANSQGEIVDPSGGGIFRTEATDAFGRLRVSEPFTLGDYKHTYGTDSSLLNYTVSGGAINAQTNLACVRLSVTTTSGSRAVHQSKMYHHYMPGKSQLIKSTFNFWGANTGVRKRTGYFDDQNGIFLELTGSGELAFNIRSFVTGSVDDATNRVPRSNWNIDKCDGSGPSGYNILLDKTHIFWTDFQWLGVGIVRCGFVHNGKYITAHEYYNDNVKSTVYMSNPNLPVRCEIENTGGGVSAYMDQICSTVISEGGYIESGSDWSVINPSLRTLASGASMPVLAIRLKSSYKSYSNRTFARLTHVGVFSSSENVKYEVVKLPNAAALTTAGAWSTVNSESSVEYNAVATAFSGGEVIDSGWAPASSQNVNKPFANVSPGSPPSLAKKNFIAQNYSSTDSEIYAVVITNLSASNTSVGVSLQWREVL